MEARLGAPSRPRARSLLSESATVSAVPFLARTLSGSPSLPSLASYETADGSRRVSRTKSPRWPLRAELETEDQLPPLDSIPRLSRPEVSRAASSQALASVCEITASSSSSWIATGRGRSLSETTGGRRRANSWKSGKLEGIERERQEEEVVDDPLAGHKLRRGRSFTTIALPVLPATPEVEIEEPKFTTTEFDSASSTVVEPTPPLGIRQFAPQLVYIVILFIISFIVVSLAIASLPNLFLPRKLAQLPELAASLSLYRAADSLLAELHLFAVLNIVYVAQNAWSIPGAVLTNVLFGAMYGPIWGSVYACLGTAFGSTGAYFLGREAKPLVEYYLSKPLAMTRKATTGPDLFSFLLLARLFPLLPYSILNLLSGCLELPLSTFFLTLVLGSFPFNFATVSIGELVALAANGKGEAGGGLDQIWSSEVMRKLVLVTVVSVLPLVFKKQIIALVNSKRLGSSARTTFLALISPILPTPSTTSLSSPNSDIELLTIDGRPQPAQPISKGGDFRRKWNKSWGGAAAGGGHRFERVLVRSTVLGSASLELGDRVREGADGKDGFF